MEDQPRDAEGHFISKDEAKSHQSTNPISRFLHDETAIHKAKDDELIDIHIGNPLRRITELLEQIKKQKAFSFTLKGSLGIMGIALVVGTFGFLGGTKALCDKGTMTKLGTVRELSFKENSERTLLYYIPFLDKLFPDRKVARKILIGEDNRIYHILFKQDTTPYPLPTTTYLLTGSYDSCSETLTVDDQLGIQQFMK